MVFRAAGVQSVARCMAVGAAGFVLAVGTAAAAMAVPATYVSGLPGNYQVPISHNTGASGAVRDTPLAGEADVIAATGDPYMADPTAPYVITPTAPDPDPGEPEKPPEPDNEEPEVTAPQTTAKPDDSTTEPEPTLSPPTPTAETTDPTPPATDTATAAPTEPGESVSPSETATESPSAEASATPSANTPRPSQRPATPPAALDSTIPIEMVVAAAVVLVLAIVGVVLLTRRSRRLHGGPTGSAGAAGPVSPGPVSPGPQSPGRVSPGRVFAGPVSPGRAASAETRPVPQPHWPQVEADVTAQLPVIGAAGAPVGGPAPGSPLSGGAVSGGAAVSPSTDRENSELMSFLVDLGGAMIDSGDPVTHVIASLLMVARANGVPDAEVVVMATALFVSVPGETMSTAVAAAGTRPLRLEQIDAVFEVVHAAERGEIGPVEGQRRLAAAREMPPSFSPRAQVGGYVVFTLGLSLIMQSSLTEIALALALGAAVGLLEQWASRFSQPFQVFLPVSSAFGVSVAVFLLGRMGMDVSGFTSLIAPLVTFIPGALLTTGVIELATGQIVSGSGRLAAGAMRLVLLALGILSAAQLVGVPATNVAQVAPNPLGEFSAWVGVAVFGLGIVVNRCARREALPWILVILYVAYAGQVLGGLFFGASLAAFCGAVVMTPVAMFVASQKSGPTTLVSFLPGFWILVPGSVGLVGVTNLLGEQQDVGFATLMSAGATMVSIALGVMLGLAVSALLRSPIRLMGPGDPSEAPPDDWTGTLIGLPLKRD